MKELKIPKGFQATKDREVVRFVTQPYVSGVYLSITQDGTLVVQTVLSPESTARKLRKSRRDYEADGYTVVESGYHQVSPEMLESWKGLSE